VSEWFRDTAEDGMCSIDRDSHAGGWATILGSCWWRGVVWCSVTGGVLQEGDANCLYVCMYVEKGGMI
jgi:hypothetical protein